MLINAGGVCSRPHVKLSVSRDKDKDFKTRESDCVLRMPGCWLAVFSAGAKHMSAFLFALEIFHPFPHFCFVSFFLLLVPFGSVALVY